MNKRQRSRLVALAATAVLTTSGIVLADTTLSGTMAPSDFSYNRIIDQDSLQDFLTATLTGPGGTLSPGDQVTVHLSMQSGFALQGAPNSGIHCVVDLGENDTGGLADNDFEGDAVVSGFNVPVVPLDLRYFYVYGDDSSTPSEIQFTNTTGMASNQPILITGIDASFLFPAAKMSDNGPAPISLDMFRFSFVTDPMQSADPESEPQLTTIVSVPEPMTTGIFAVLCASGLVFRARRAH